MTSYSVKIWITWTKNMIVKVTDFKIPIILIFSKGEKKKSPGRMQPVMTQTIFQTKHILFWGECGFVLLFYSYMLLILIQKIFTQV